MSLLLFRDFLGIGSLAFSVSQHAVRGPCGVVHGTHHVVRGPCGVDKDRFYENNIFLPKMGKIGHA